APVTRRPRPPDGKPSADRQADRRRKLTPRSVMVGARSGRNSRISGGNRGQEGTGFGDDALAELGIADLVGAVHRTAVLVVVDAGAGRVVGEDRGDHAGGCPGITPV